MSGDLKGGLFLKGALMALSVFGLPMTSSAGGREILRVGYTTNGYGVKGGEMEKEVAVALDVLLSQALVGSGHGSAFQAFGDEKELLRALLSGSLDVADISSLGYASLTPEEREILEPVFIPQMSKEPLERFVLLAKPGVDLASLRGKKLRVSTGIHRGLGRVWLARELGVAKAEEYFEEIEGFPKAEEVVLPTFFGKADACLVRENDYELLAELNPQIATRLKPVLTSPGFIFSLVVARKDLDAEAKAELADLAGDLREDTRARQAFMLLRIEKLGRFEPKLMDLVFETVKAVGAEAGPEVLLVTPNEEVKGGFDAAR